MKHHRLNTAIVAVLAAAAALPDGLLPGRAVARVTALANDQAELMLYGPIGELWWGEGITAASIVAKLDAIRADTIVVRINSDGGHVPEGLAIHNALKRHPARIVVEVDGQAASIASLIAMAGDEVVMAANSLMMIHAPYLCACGNARDMREFAEQLDVHSEAMAASYIAKCGDAEAVKGWLDGSNHWFTAADAVAAGLADRVGTGAVSTTTTDEAAAAALLGYVHAIANADGPVAAQLRGHLQAAVTPTTFTSLPEATQRAVVAHIEDPTMKQRYQHILANAGGPAASATPAAAAAPAAPAAPVAAAATVVPPAGDSRAEVLAAQRDRNTAILAAARAHAGNEQIVALRDEALGNPEMAVEAFNARALAILGSQATPVSAAARVEAGRDERDARRTAMGSAVEARLGLAQASGDNPFRGFALRDLARECAAHAGVNVRGMDPVEVVRAAITHTSSDFPALMGDSVRRAVLRGYEELPEVFDQFTRAISVPDFRKTSLAGLGHFVGVDIVREGGEYKYGTFSDMGQEVKLEKAGGLFSITDEAIINDDLSLLDAIPSKMGRAARSNLGDRVFALLTGNPVLADGVALFHADHGNLVSPGSDLTTATIDGIRVLMATQKDANGKTIRVRLKYLLVPVGKGGLARQILESQYEVGTTKANTAPNYVRNSFEVIEDPRLDDHNPNAWYGIADPNVVDGIVIAYRDGVQTPRVTQKEGWNVDGIEFKVRLDAAPAIADYVGLAKNPGAA